MVGDWPPAPAGALRIIVCLGPYLKQNEGSMSQENILSAAVVEEPSCSVKVYEEPSIVALDDLAELTTYTVSIRV